jgi:hypothetical protein
MPFFMTHLIIAKKLSERVPIQDRGAFYLGSIAPDAISFRPGKARSDKWDTHFCAGGGRWGYLEDPEAWRDSIRCGLKQYAGHVDRDFLFGYTAHVLTDFENYARLWNPVRMQCDEESVQSWRDGKGGGDSLIATWTRDNVNAEAVMFGRLGDTASLWPVLYKSNRHVLPGLFTRGDVALMLDYMKDTLYAGMKPAEGFEAGVYGLPVFEKFIEDCVEICYGNY